MFTLKNEYGNVFKTVATQREKENLEALGYTVVSDTTYKNKAVKSKNTKTK